MVLSPHRLNAVVVLLDRGISVYAGSLAGCRRLGGAAMLEEQSQRWILVRSRAKRSRAVGTRVFGGSEFTRLDI